MGNVICDVIQSLKGSEASFWWLQEIRICFRAGIEMFTSFMQSLSRGFKALSSFLFLCAFVSLYYGM
jgi:hypothetical protein